MKVLANTVKVGNQISSDGKTYFKVEKIKRFFNSRISGTTGKFYFLKFTGGQFEWTVRENASVFVK